VFAVSVTGFRGGADKHIRHSTHGRNHYQYFRVLGLLSDDLSHTLHTLGIAHRCAAELHYDQRLVTSAHSPINLSEAGSPPFGAQRVLFA
jgi:hypothetical protein